MDQPSVQNQSAPAVVKETKNKPILILIAFLILAVGILLGFYANILLASKKIQNTDKTTIQPARQKIDESKLPISLDLLQNPVVYQWRGSVEGTLVEKNDDSITIRDDKGNSITILNRVSPKSSYPAMMTVFFDSSSPKGPIKKVAFGDLVVGSRLRGDFFVVPGDKNIIVGSSFEIIKKPTP